MVNVVSGMIDSSVTRTLREAVDGPVHRPGDEGYDRARLPWQRAVDPYPALVVEAAGPRDVRAAVRVARDHDLPFAVQATGHGALHSYEGGLLLRTSAMNGVEIDPERRTARVGAGALWGDVVAAAAPYGLAPLSGSSPTVGVVGYTVGGGAGWLSRAYGFAADSVLSADVVTANGERITADAERHPELFWALRGGGGGFAVVTSLEFRLHPVGTVYGGMAMFGFDRAAETLARYREWAAGEPDESNTALMLVTMPDSPELPEMLRGRRVLGLRALYMGEAAAAERALAPLREAAGPPLMDAMRPMDYAGTSTLLGPPPGPTAAVSAFDLFREIPDAMIDAAVGAVAEGDWAGAIEIRHWGGAMARPQEGAGPAGHRDVPFSAALGAELGGTPGVREAVRRASGMLRPYATGGTFLNFLTDPGRTATAYRPADLRRLAEVKRMYDPDLFFRRGHSVRPAGDESGD